MPRISWRKLSLTAEKSQNSWKFSPSKISHCTVYLHRLSRSTSQQVFNLEQNLEDPLKEAPMLRYTRNGIKRSGTQPLKSCQREPITIPILHKLKAQLQAYSNFNCFDKHLLWAAFMSAFCSFLRGGELTTSSLHNFNPLWYLSVDNVVISYKCLWLAIKMDQFR